ncbi:uncharacterized protein LOC126574851 [Anopheles aquasalis]|uniref:uncharacterized protein LOC126574851 n=1 Tax=Anopheles aquasalis TaxID=42839 RepID=UPI00215A4AA8|nr:uncharacterized protein LOC126574851 [Anopheles aquasalis]
METPGPSRRPGGSNTATSNLSGLKHQLHGTSYQLKLGMVVGMANAKKSTDPNNNFSFTVMAEGRDESEVKSRDRVDKFDDIVYTFKHGAITGTLKIQAKHKLSPTPCNSAVQAGGTNGEQSVPKITLNDFIADSKNDFCIQQYFKSFRDQPKAINEATLEGFIICTNADLDDDAKVIWNEVDTAALGPSLDSYASSLFNKVRGKSYQLKTHYKRAALAKLLINAVKSKDQMVTWQRPLFKEYRAAILDIIGEKSTAANVPLFKFTNNFLDPTYSNSKPGYDAFKKEFTDQFRREFGLNEIAWELFKGNIQIHVAENFLLDEKNKFSSSDSFPDDNVDPFFKCFCDRFRLVCGTYNEQGIDDAIATILGDWCPDGNHTAAVEKLFKYFFDWLKDPFATSLHSDDIKTKLENVQEPQPRVNLEKLVKEKLREEFRKSPLRINFKTVRKSFVKRCRI